MIDGRNFFEWSIEGKDIKTFEGIRKIATSKGDDYTTGCLLNNKFLMLILEQFNRLILQETSIMQEIQ